MPGEKARQRMENLFAVAGRHPYRARLGLPTTEEELGRNFPGLMESLRKDTDEIFGPADSAYTSSSSGFDFNVMNNMLRGGTLPTKDREIYLEMTVRLMLGMEPLTPGTFYRGISLRNIPALRNLCGHLDAHGLRTLRGYTGTKRFQDNGFISTSKAELGAGRFVNGKPDSALLVITTALGARGREPVSEHRGEREMILAPGTSFDVTSVTKGRVTGGGSKEYYRIAVTAE